MVTMVRTKRPEEALLDEVLCEQGPVREIILYNDEVNTFDHVIESLMEVCEHDPVQAEQCAWITHYKGRCSVKRGTFDTLEPRCTALQDRGLSADIQ
ncbi:MAG: ATP-dependent Clp protease adaptor ClpS [Flavobacteriales bacterium]|nr:ATP-dependent Clp protease adaptor ClpS [Flavobacteriales bacterium]MCB9193904.1 ATP-dependent Clp protease adaptor ClpS [Flavobacteriales bacterium]